MLALSVCRHAWKKGDWYHIKDFIRSLSACTQEPQYHNYGSCVHTYIHINNILTIIFDGDKKFWAVLDFFLWNLCARIPSLHIWNWREKQTFPVVSIAQFLHVACRLCLPYRNILRGTKRVWHFAIVYAACDSRIRLHFVLSLYLSSVLAVDQVFLSLRKSPAR